jgi:hypothetical protein
MAQQSAIRTPISGLPRGGFFPCARGGAAARPKSRSAQDLLDLDLLDQDLADQDLPDQDLRIEACQIVIRLESDHDLVALL